ncbi:disease resistance protein RUN1-like [Rosa rugosa]|uniref:disease resistance protein RUN1-like n=1 Tax=Rosa rugosa TaxID=74645 RepID=UPI002B4085CE|nr:disease resistance protein RUN1-like [Rosa rugosa]
MGHESKFIKKIVKVIEDKISRTPLNVAPYLIGIHSRVEDINLWLQDKSTDGRILVICGMRGIGKTTIAKFVYNSNFKRFEGCSFLENIREVSGQPNGLVQLQKQLISDVLNGRKVKVHSISEGIIKVEDAISSKKVLLVLDDVDHKDQLEAIVSMQDRLCQGSKIIITTSRIGLFKDHQKFEVHNVEGLDYSESLELFSWHAFGQDHPIEGYMELSARVVHHSAGLPLALKVLGSSLSGTIVDVWKDALNKLESIPDDEILKKLKISFDSLQDDHDRNLFLHIASFFTGMDIYVIVQILESCNFYPTIGIQNLIDRCLVTIDGYNKVQMHHMIRDMGRGIVLLESEEPQKRSRLWNHKDSLEVLTKKNGTERIEGLILNMRRYTAYTPQISNEVVFETNAFASMHKLRLLQLTNVKFRGYYKGFLTELRWLCWNEYPFCSLPNDFPLERLVVLEMCYSGLRKVWKGAKSLPSLKMLNLSHSHSLTETPDFSRVPNLERLILKDCTSMVDVHKSIGNLERLVYLDVEGCKNIRRLPMLKFLETLILSGCSNLNEFPMEMVNINCLKVLQADGVPIRQLPPSKNPEICRSSCVPCNLVELSLTGCNLSDDDFPWDFGNLSSLRSVRVSNHLKGYQL